jgi:PAS domain S-box-containing protein
MSENPLDRDRLTHKPTDAVLSEANEALQAEIAAHQRAEEELGLLLTLIRSVSEAQDFQSALAITLQNVCEFTHWDYGEAWVPDADSTGLILHSAWHRAIDKLEKFERLSREFSFPPGVGLPGSVWRTLQPQWVADLAGAPVERYRRAPMAAEAGLKAGLGVPVTVADRVVAVLVFHMFERRDADSRMITIVSVAAEQLGSVLQQKQLGDDLYKRETLLRAILDNSTSIIYLKDKNGKYLNVNFQFQNLFRLPLEEISGKTDYDIFPKDVAEVFQANDRKVVEAAAPMEFEETAPHHDGMHTYLASKYPMYDASGSLYAVCSILTDITDQKRHTESLRVARDELEKRVQERTAAMESEIAERRRIEEEMQARVRQQAAVVQVGQCALGLDDLLVLMDEASVVVAETLGVEYCKVLELLPDGNSLILRAGFGWKEGVVGQERVSAGTQSQAGYTLLSGKPVIVEDLSTETRFIGPSLLREHGVVSGMSVIIPGRDRPFGILGTHTVKRRAFNEDDIHFLESVANVLSEAIERKRTEQALRGSEEQLRLALQFNQAVMANMGEGLYVLDTGGLVTYINPTAERLFGWSSAELLGRKMHDVTHYRHADGTPFPADECPGLQVLQEGVALADHEDVFIRKDGTFFHVVYSSSPIRLEGAVVGLVVVFRDVTTQKQAEEAVQRSASWLRSLIATTQDAVLSIDRRGCVVLFNPAAERIFGYVAEEMVGHKVNELMAEPYASEHDGYIARYERTGEARAIGLIRSVTAKRKNGELFPIELSVTEIEVDQEVHYAAFIRDISEKAKLQEQLVERERLATIGTTAAKIGHELANPLNGMSLTIQLLEQRLSRQPGPTDSQATATVQRLKNEISRLNQLAGQFRTISRRERYDFQPTELAGLIDEVIRIQRPHLVQLNIEIDQLIPTDLPIVTVDKDKIKQALLNLVKNAAEAMPGGGKINIEARATENGVLIEITDTGMGIPLDIDVFEPFVTTKKEGTGIGLVIVRQIVTAHGGNISYRSRPGEGTTFRIELAQR